MKKIIINLITVIVTTTAFSQATWNFSIKKISDKTYEVHLMATIDESWHIYSQSTPGGGPSATEIVFSKNPLVTISGKPKEVGDVVEKFEEVFGVEVIYYENKVDYVQKITLKSNVKTNITGTVEYMACSDKQCMPLKKEQFNLRIQ